jgi:hypothetical protein
MLLYAVSLLQKPSVTQAHNIWVTENSVTHMEQSEKSAINIDQAAGSMWMTEFSVTLMLWACVTRRLFFNSVGLRIRTNFSRVRANFSRILPSLNF